MICLQLCLYCLLFTAMVRYSVRGGAINGLYFYPKAVQERAYEIGLTDRETVKKQRRRFMTLFYIVMLTALVLIIAVWNQICDFETAYLQALLFLEVMNIYDGTVIDKLWVGHSKFWILKGTEDIPFVQTWMQVLKKRSFLALIWIIGAAIAAGLVVLLAKVM
ncbi:MAG: hypothetical protein IJL32_03430 [Oscillospiraceae bacterium]|nr:hypothetical protein [Oscillospiraceae bacterium]